MSRFPPEFLAKIREALPIVRDAERIASVHKASMFYSWIKAVREDLESLEDWENHKRWIDNGRKPNITALKERFAAFYGNVQ